MDAIDEIVSRAIEYTRSILLSTPAHRELALSGLRRMSENLASGAPGHPALTRLIEFLAEIQDETDGGSLH